MKKEITIEMLDNGLLFRYGSWSEAVLYDEEKKGDDDAQYLGCQRYIGCLVTDELFDEESETSAKCREMYSSMGKATVGYRVSIDIEPLTKIVVK